MKPTLKNLTFTTRLIAITLVPLIAFILTMTYLFYQSIHAKQHLDELKVLPEFSIYASALVHNLQIERGLSAGYLGSKGKKFGNQLSNHRQKTDDALAAYKKATQLYDLKAIYGNAQQPLDTITKQLAQLDTARSNISAQSWSTQQAVKYYTGINTKILAFIETLSASSGNNEISKLGLSSVNFMNVKERAGIIRAVLANTFVADRFGPGMREKFITLLAEQHIFLSKFKHFSDEATVAAYTKLTQKPVFKEVAHLRDIALNHKEGGFGVDAGHWFQKQTEKINELKAFEDKLTNNTRTSMAALSVSAQYELWIESAIAGATLLFTILLSLTLIHRLSRESHTMPQALERISKGELSLDTYDYDTPAFRALNRMQKKLIEVNSAIENVTHTVRSSAQEISASNTSLAQRAEEQASNLEKTAASMEEITATVRLTSENLEQGDKLSGEAHRYANDGQLIVGKAVSAMQEINDDSQKIADIINVIDEIAFQTNLLALNAAVEAARAGEQGRGFAVVASEVRNLAQRSAESAQEIKTLIEASVKKIHSGSELVNASGESLAHIVSAVNKVSEIISEITTAGKEQAVGVEQINESIMKLDDVNQQNAAMVEEVAVSSKVLEEQSRELEKLISFYQINSNKTKVVTAEKPLPTAHSEMDNPPLRERRSADRPWSSNAATAPSLAPQAPADDAWEAF